MKVVAATFAFSLMAVSNVWAQPVYSTPVQTPNQDIQTEHPVADGVGNVARSGARALGDVVGGVAQGIDDLAHTTARAVNPDPTPVVIVPAPQYVTPAQSPPGY